MLPGQKFKMPCLMAKEHMIALTWWYVSFMPSFRTLSKSLKRASWVTWLVFSTLLNFRREVNALHQDGVINTMSHHDVQLICYVQISYFFTIIPFNGSGKIRVALFNI